MPLPGEAAGDVGACGLAATMLGPLAGLAKHCHITVVLLGEVMVPYPLGVGIDVCAVGVGPTCKAT